MLWYRTPINMSSYHSVKDTGIMSQSTPYEALCRWCCTIIQWPEFIKYRGSDQWQPVCPGCAEAALLADEQHHAVELARRIIRRTSRRLAKAGAK